MYFLPDLCVGKSGGVQDFWRLLYRVLIEKLSSSTSKKRTITKRNNHEKARTVSGYE